MAQAGRKPLRIDPHAVPCPICGEICAQRLLYHLSTHGMYFELGPVEKEEMTCNCGEWFENIHYLYDHLVHEWDIHLAKYLMLTMEDGKCLDLRST